jgi:hypothetical protein
MDDCDSKTVRAGAVLRLLLVLGVGLLPTLGWTEDPAPVPDHAYIDVGDHWKCDRGFKRVADRCEEIQLPEHAFLQHGGNSWRCERGYKRVKEQCQRVQVPEHAFLNTWGDGWECERGFRRSGDRCGPE